MRREVEILKSVELTADEINSLMGTIFHQEMRLYPKEERKGNDLLAEIMTDLHGEKLLVMSGVDDAGNRQELVYSLKDVFDILVEDAKLENDRANFFLRRLI